MPNKIPESLKKKQKWTKPDLATVLNFTVIDQLDVFMTEAPQYPAWVEFNEDYLTAKKGQVTKYRGPNADKVIHYAFDALSSHSQDLMELEHHFGGKGKWKEVDHYAKFMIMLVKYHTSVGIWKRDVVTLEHFQIVYRILACLLAEHGPASIKDSNIVKKFRLKEKDATEHAMEQSDDTSTELLNEDRQKYERLAMGMGGVLTLHGGWAATAMNNNMQAKNHKFFGFGNGEGVVGGSMFGKLKLKSDIIVIDWVEIDDDSSSITMGDQTETKLRIPDHWPSVLSSRDHLVKSRVPKMNVRDRKSFKLWENMAFSIRNVEMGEDDDIGSDLEGLVSISNDEQIAAQVMELRNPGQELPTGKEGRSNAMAEVSEEEMERFKKESEFLDGLSGNAPDWSSSVKALNIASDSKMWMPGTSSQCQLKSWQPQGIYWLVTTCGSRLGGAILADCMGLGKTIQALCFLAYRNQEKVSIEGWGGHKPSMVIVPQVVARQWEKAIETYLTSDYRVHVYTVDRETTLDRSSVCKMNEYDIIVASYSAMTARHGQLRIEQWASQNATRPVIDCPLNLQGLFAVLVLDEAHLVKNTESKRARMALNMKPAKTILLTGTPADNRVADLKGLLSLFNTENLWLELGVPETFNPFKVDDDDERSILRVTLRAFDNFIEPLHDAPHKQAKYLKLLYRKIMLRRTYATKIRGVPIGDDIPMQASRNIQLVVAADYQSKLNDIMKVQRKDLFTRLENDRGEIILRIDGAKARNLVQATTWLPFGELGLVSQDNLSPYWDNKLSLKDLMIYFFGRIQDKLGFDPRSINDNDVLARVASGSKKLEWLGLLAARLTTILNTKVIVWVQYPGEEMLILKVLQASGLSAEAYHSGLTNSQRHGLIDKFNQPNKDPKILISTYNVAGIGLNLQGACWHTVLFTPAMNLPSRHYAGELPS